MSSTKGREYTQKKEHAADTEIEKPVDLNSMKKSPTIVNLIDLSDPKTQEILSHVEKSLNDFEYTTVSKVIESEFGDVSFKNNKKLLSTILNHAKHLD